MLNDSPLNGAALNASETRIHYAGAVMSAGVAAAAVAGVLVAVTVTVPAVGSIVIADLYQKRGAIADVPAASAVHIQSTAFVRRVASASPGGSASVDPQVTQLHDTQISLSATADILAYTGDGADLAGTASIQADAGQTHTSDAAIPAAATVSATVNLHADGAQPIKGVATVDAVPSVQYAGDAFITHDGHARLLGTLTAFNSTDPLKKYSFIVHNPSGATVQASPSIDHAAVVAASVNASVVSGPGIYRLVEAQALLPAATVAALGHRKVSNDEAVSISGTGGAIFTAKRQRLTFSNVAGEASVEAVGSRYHYAGAVMSCGVTGLSADGVVRAFASASITGDGVVLANLVSNPRAHAPERRVAVMLAEEREMTIPSEDRTMRISPT